MVAFRAGPAKSDMDECRACRLVGMRRGGGMVRIAHALISGRVQGVGYRAWIEDEAVARGLSGWVRNRRDGSVEALFCGDAPAVEAMLSACWTGPRLAVVDSVTVHDMPIGPLDRHFRVLPTA
jgi:acylphosphatase